MWLTHFWHSWSQFFIFAWDVTAGGILRTGVLICLVDITIDLFNLEDQYSPWNNGAALCLQSRPHLGLRMRVSGCYTREARVTQSATWVGSSLLDSPMLLLYFIVFTLTYLFDCIYVHLMTMEDWLFSQHRPPAQRHQQSCHLFLLAVVTSGDCAFHVLRKICRIKNIITIYFHIWM